MTKSKTFHCVMMLLLTSALVATPLAAEDAPSSSQAPKAQAIIENAWVRAMPPSQHSTAAYLTLHNGGKTALTIIGANSVPHANIEMHSSAVVDGMMRMEHKPTITVAPGESLEFGPGGLHLMMMGMQKMPQVGEQVKLCLELAAAAQICTIASVNKAGPSPDSSTQNHQHH